ncbi:putative kelch repeat protein [Diaporthe ampelina]|uniref:Putative kelch repeat protein n=1 Tax=Diaporthe ampelina TaxID=1214573 RepID=A0A0G2FQA1_9PEZI|nr:putative kelch repeat protein [Diaporthe ampelina]
MKKAASDGYRPKVTRTLGQRPACLVNASVTYCGNNQIYAFGGFDQYTDEVYNHVLRLDIVSHQWSLVDNYGDIPGVRMATLYQGDKLLVFGGENEHRTYLSDLIIFDLKTAHWTQPQVTGPIPKGRARHSALLHEDKLFIIGGITGHDNYVLDDICYIDLKTFTWSRAWRFVGRFDHSAYIWGDRIWVFGGLSEDMDKVSDLWWLDLKGSPAFETNGFEEQLSDIMEIDLRRYGFLGNNLTPQPRNELAEPMGRTRRVDTPSKGLGADLAKAFNKPPEAGSGADFVVTALSGDPNEEDLLGSALIRATDVADGDQTWLSPDSPTSPPIHVHRLILYLRWPHFARLWDSHMAEFHNKKMHIPEPYTVVKAFLYYLYTDRIDAAPEDEGVDGPSRDLADIAGLLVMSNIYNIPHLRLLCVNRLSRELDVDHACIIWYCAGLADEEWLRKRAAGFCLTHWGRIVRTTGFLRLPRTAIVELSQEIDTEGRVIGGEELDMFEGGGSYMERRKESISSNVTQSLEAEEAEDDDGMDMN